MVFPYEEDTDEATPDVTLKLHKRCEEGCVRANTPATRSPSGCASQPASRLTPSVPPLA